jgi:hypothetical protein
MKGHLRVALLFTASLAACIAARNSVGNVAESGMNVNTLTADEQQKGWRLLFDGKTLNGWRGYNRADMPAGWAAQDGALTRVSQAADIITTDQFGDFELELEWRIAPGGNSGIFYRAAEGLDAIYMSAPGTARNQHRLT